MRPLMIRIGNFFFRYRNRLFPLIVVALFAIDAPRPSFTPMDAVAIGLTFARLLLRGWVIGYAYIKRGRLNKQVYADQLVTEGWFGVCRNPLYVGNMLIYSGVFLLHGSPIVAAAGICVFLFIYQCIIYAEEAFLQNKFGDAYARYCEDVARWMPRPSRYRAATASMQFQLGRALQKDYSTIATACVMLVLTIVYKGVYNGQLSFAAGSAQPLLGLVGMIVLWAFAVRYFKKRALLGQI